MKKLSKVTVPKVYAIVAIIISLLCIGGYFSYAMFTVTKEKGKAISIEIGDFNYSISGVGVTNGRVSVPANGEASFTLIVSSLNKTVSRYQLYYLNNSNVDVYYDPAFGKPNSTLGTQIDSKPFDIELYIVNHSNSTQTVTFGIQGGFENNAVVLESGRTAVSKVNSFNVSSRTVTGGSITVSDTATAGKTLNFTTNPNSGFTYYGATVRDSSGATLMTLDSNTTSFKMPAQTVTISPKWKHDDQIVFALDSSDDGAWSQKKQEGASSAAQWQTDRHYLYFFGSDGLSRVVAWSNKAYDLTHYATYRAQGYQSGASANLTFSTAVATTNSSFISDLTSNKTSLVAPGNDTWFTIDLNITNLTGNYYLAYEVLSSVSYAAPFGNATLIGRVYE